MTMMIIVINLLMINLPFNFAPHRASAASAEPASPGNSAAAEIEPAPGSANRTPLANVLNADGTLNVTSATNGSYNVSGYRMATTAAGAPRFVPTGGGPPGTGRWDTQFDLLAGVNGAVFALLVSGNDFYVDGSFTEAGNVAANRVARFNTITNTWSVLGSGASNGVNFLVFALAVGGSDLYVGGDFTVSAGASAYHVARFNTQTNTWSALGTGAFLDNGVSGPVYSLAVIGTDVYAGGFFQNANSGGVAISAKSIAKFNTQTSTWSALGPEGNGVNNPVTALAVIGNNL